MRASLRDNLIYLGVALAVVVLVVADFFYADSHGRSMFIPSPFIFHAIAYLVMLEYFVVKEVRKVGAGLGQVVLCLVGAAILHAGVVVAFRGTYSEHLDFSLFVLALLEFFVVVQLMVWVARKISS